MNLIHIICYTSIKVLNVNTLLQTAISSSAFNAKRFMYLGIFKAMEHFTFFPPIPLVWHSNAMYMPWKCLNIK